MTKEAKLYLRTLLEYAEAADGFQDCLTAAFHKEDASEAEFDQFLLELGDLSSEIHTFLED
jgi:hypothetical protein